MTVKEHYDNHLAEFYSWMIGDFDKAKESFKIFCNQNNIEPTNQGFAIDLGAGNGIQSMALAEIGFAVQAVDFNDKLLNELKLKIAKYPIECIYEDILNIKSIATENSVDLVICCGDTIAHIETFEQLEKLLEDCYNLLSREGKLILSFRDYSNALTDTQRFISVRSDENQILTCVIDYYEQKIKVTDLLHVKEGNTWKQRISSYDKLRITKDYVNNKLKNLGYTLITCTDINRMVYVIAKK
jgi:2-polyprenyl-3-methyl-5-hydroxy-6-metoxy-1,4-benzoquinol methylase